MQVREREYSENDNGADRKKGEKHYLLMVATMLQFPVSHFLSYCCFIEYNTKKKKPSKKDLKFGEAHYSKIDQNYCQNKITPTLELLPKGSGRRIRIRTRTRRTEKGCCYYVFQDCFFLSRNQPRGGDGWLIKSFLPPHPLFLSKESAFVPCLIRELLLWMSVLRHNDRVSWKVKWLWFTVTEHWTGR